MNVVAVAAYQLGVIVYNLQRLLYPTSLHLILNKTRELFIKKSDLQKRNNSYSSDRTSLELAVCKSDKLQLQGKEKCLSSTNAIFAVCV